MRAILTTVGEHLIRVEGNSAPLMRTFERNFHFLTEATERQPDLIIQLEDGYGVPFVDYEVTIAKQSNQIHFHRADYRIEADLDYRNARMAVCDELALKHAFIHLFSSYIVHHRWGLLLHSSCAVEAGRAHLFAGSSGAGKSTAARWSAPRQLLSDEATLVKITPQEITVFNSPFRSELKVTGSEQTSPLASIQLLVQAAHNQRIPLTKSEGLMQLMDKIFYWAHDPVETGSILSAIHTLANTVPIYELHFQNNPTFWELIS